KQAVRAMLCGDLTFPVLMSGAIPVGTVLIITLTAIACSVQPPAIDAAKSVSVVEDDAAPQPPGTAGPHRSLFQTDSLALRVKLPVTWVARDPAGVAFVTGVKW